MATPITGYATITEPDAPLVERDTTTCGHCQRVIFVKPHTLSTIYVIFDRETSQWCEAPGCGCFLCQRPICLRCHDLGTCRPWQEQLARSEARDRLRRQILGQVTG